MGAPINRNSRAVPPDPSSDDGTREAGAGVEMDAPEKVPLHTHYLNLGASGAVELPVGETPMAAICFGAARAGLADVVPRATIAMAPLDSGPCCELWTSELPVEYGESSGIRYATNGQLLFGAISDAAGVSDAGFEERVRRIYDAVFATMESREYPHLLRLWNYFPEINAEFDGLENYRRFSRARALAFQEHFGDYILRLPSASAIGTHDGPFVVYFIAAREPGTHRENPRQLSAYSYPVQYGPRSPSFARATLKRIGGRELFFISGTASIVGHESMHCDDLGGQIDETLCNIEALIDSTCRDEAVTFHGLSDISHMKVYLRRPRDLASVRETIRKRVGPNPEVLYLHGDICRVELLVEIEAIVGPRVDR